MIAVALCVIAFLSLKGSCEDYWLMIVYFSLLCRTGHKAINTTYILPTTPHTELKCEKKSKSKEKLHYFSMYLAHLYMG